MRQIAGRGTNRDGVLHPLRAVFGGVASALGLTFLIGLAAASGALAATGLPDGRVYEMVSPPNKGNAEVAVPGNAGGESTFSVEPIQASADGEGMTYPSFTSFGEADGAPLTGQYLSRRGPEGWLTENVNPIFEEAFARDPFVGFAPDLSNAAVISLNPPLAPGAPKDTWNLYWRNNVGGGFVALTQGKPEVSPFAEYCLGFAGASRNFDRVAFMAKGALIPGDPVAINPNLYEWHREPADARQTLTVRAEAGEYTLTATAAKGEGTLTTGSAVVADVEVTSAAGTFHVGDVISGVGVPAGTTVTEVGADSLTLSASATTDGVQKLTATETTGALAAGASAANVQSALQALPAIGIGNIVVGGGPGDPTGSSPYSMQFGGDLAGTQVPRLTATSVSLSGGIPSSSAVVVSLEPGGHLRLVSVLPNGVPATPQAQTGFGVGGFFFACNMETALLRHAVSADGRRMFWTYAVNSGFPGGRRPLFARIIDGSENTETVQLDASQGGVGQGEGRFQDASVDGSKVFFTDVQKLTADSTAAAGRPDLYRYDFDEPLGSRLTDLTVKPLLSPNTANVLGVLGTSEGGNTVYFAATGILTTAANPKGATAVDGEANIYAWRDGEPIRFIGTIPTVQPDNANWTASLDKQTARTSPSGRYLAFMSTRSLTGYDNTVAGEGVCQLGLSACTEVFLYDLEAEELVCASCNPSGVRPIGASRVPNWSTPYEQSRYLLDSGRVFFETKDSLASVDINEKQDVYEFQKAGVGSCTTASPDFSAITGSCVSLISQGESTDESYFLDASVDGRDVFISSRQQLVPQRDKDESFDVYDARIGGSPPPSPPARECAGEGCRTPGDTPGISSPGTSGFVAPPVARDPRPCGRKKVRRKGRCVPRKQRKRSGNHRKRGTHADRGTNR